MLLPPPTTIKLMVFGVSPAALIIAVELNFVMTAILPWIHMPIIVPIIKSSLPIFLGYLFLLPEPEEKEVPDQLPVANIFLMLYLSLPKIIYQDVGVAYADYLPHQPNRHY